MVRAGRSWQWLLPIVPVSLLVLVVLASSSRQWLLPPWFLQVVSASGSWQQFLAVVPGSGSWQ